MQPPKNYSLGRCLRAGTKSEVYAAVRDSDGLEVVLKSYLHDIEVGEESRAHREFKALRACASDEVVRAIELVSDRATPVLVLARVPGVPLNTWADELPSPEAFLEVAIQAARALSRVHDARLVHRDLHPGNIIVDPQSLRTFLIDFGLARPLGTAGGGPATTSSNSELAGTLYYIAPEQTGRMDRGIDSRSDLYGLGATLYHVLTGTPPFETEDPLALIHAHLARLPAPPVERRPDLPPTLSRIILKLLQKEPEERYQRAEALERDLQESLDQLRRTGRIDDDFPLGTADSPFRPLFTARLYGRDAEVRALHDAYGRVQRGGVELIVLAGAPGAGKSALVHELRRVLPESDGYLASGKYDLYRRDVPYSGLIAAFESLVHQLLTESERRLAACRESLLTSLGNLAAVAVELVPDLRMVLGDVPPVPRLGPRETQARLMLALKRLVRGWATREHPLVLFLDDLQWADPGSHELLEGLLLNSEAPSLLLIGAYRDNEVDPSHPLTGMLERLESSTLRVTRITLSPLGIDACSELLGDALNRPPAETQSLADCIVRKTGSSPLLIRQFVLHMHALGLIHFVNGTGWTWDEGAITAADIPEGAVGLMVAKLERLEPDARELLKFASCVGDQFDSRLLAELSGRSEDSLQPALFTLAEDGLIAPCERGFRFVHDRIREAAQALLSAEQRCDLHHRVGRRLLANVSLESSPERAFEIADHLNRAANALGEDDRRQALAANLTAGQRALRSGAAATAGRYLDAGCTLLREEEDWTRAPELIFSLLLESADAAYQTRQLDRALKLLDQIDGRPLDHWQWVRVSCARIRVYLRARPDEANALTLAVLRKLGIRWRARPAWLRVRLTLLRADWQLRGSIEDEPFKTIAVEDRQQLSPSLVIGAGGAALQRASVGLLCVATAYILRTYRYYGVAGSPALALAAYASYRARFRRDLRGMARYAHAAAAWTKIHPNSVASVRAQYDLWSFLYSWFEPRRKVSEELWSVVEVASELGEIEFRDYAVGDHINYLALSGQPLPALFRRIEALSRHPDGREWMINLSRYQRQYGLLHDEGGSDLDWQEVLLEADQSLSLPAWWLVNRHMHLVIILCIFGKFAQAARYAEAIVDAVFTLGPPGSYLADFTLFRGLAHAHLAESASGAVRRRHRRIARSCRSQLERWARDAQDLRHMSQFLQAELARLRGRSREALGIYRTAARLAAARGYLHHAALIHERTATLLRRMRASLESSSALTQAIEMYREWGALAVVHHLEERRREERCTDLGISSAEGGGGPRRGLPA